MGYKNNLVITCCALAMLATGNVYAQSSTKSSGAKSSGRAIETIVVTAQRRSENVQSVPISVQAFTGKTLSNLGIKSSTDLTRVTQIGRAHV